MQRVFKNNISIFIYALLSTAFFSLTVTSDTFSILDVSSMLVWSVITVVLFVIYKKLLMRSLKFQNILFIVLAGIISIVFSISSVMGEFYSAEADFSVIFAAGSKSAWLKFLLVFLGGFIFFYLMIKAIAVFTEGVSLKVPQKFQKVLSFLFEKHCFLKSFVVMTVCWIPHIIIHYPITIPVDGAMSLMQYYGLEHYTTKHSIIYMQLLGRFSDFGDFLGDVSVGLLILGLIQAVYILLTFAYTISTMEKLKVPRYIQMATLIIFSVVPMFQGYATMLLVDVPYSASILLLMNEFVWCLFGQGAYRKNWKHPLLTMIAIFGTFFRQNGFYVVVVIILFTAIYGIYLLCRRKQKARCVLLMLAALIVSLSVGKMNNAWLCKKYNCTNVSTRAMLALPIQQTARYMVYHSDDVTPDELAAIKKIIKYEPEEYKERYTPYNYDGIKQGFDYNATKKDLKEYLQTWFKMFFKHPITYINATLTQNYCLFSPLEDNCKYYMGAPGRITRITEPDYQKFYDTTLSLKPAKNLLAKYYYSFCKIPVLGLYVNQGIMDFLLLALCLCALCRKNGKFLLLALPLLLTLGVTFVGPTVLGHIRYTFPVFYAMPLLVGMCTIQKKI